MQLLTKDNATITIDDTDVDLVSSYPWEVLPTGYLGAYVNGPDGPVVMLLHRLLREPPEGCRVIHANGDKLDNRRENLTIDNYDHYRKRRANRANTNSLTGIRGVQHAPKLSPSRPWRAQISFRHHNYHLGLFATKDEAIAARRAADLCFFGDGP